MCEATKAVPEAEIRYVVTWGALGQDTFDAEQFRRDISIFAGVKCARNRRRIAVNSRRIVRRPVLVPVADFCVTPRLTGVMPEQASGAVIVVAAMESEMHARERHYPQHVEQRSIQRAVGPLSNALA